MESGVLQGFTMSQGVESKLSRAAVFCVGSSLTKTTSLPPKEQVASWGSEQAVHICDVIWRLGSGEVLFLLFMQRENDF